MPTPKTSSECVKVRLEDQERQRAREQDQTVSLLDEYWGIPDPQYPSCFPEQKMDTMARRKENRDPFLASTSSVSTLSDVSEKKGNRQMMALEKFCRVFNSQSPSILFWPTLMLLLTSMVSTPGTALTATSQTGYIFSQPDQELTPPFVSELCLISLWK